MESTLVCPPPATPGYVVTVAAVGVAIAGLFVTVLWLAQGGWRDLRVRWRRR